MAIIVYTFSFSCRIIELGPGNGTLMKDILRTLSKNQKLKNEAPGLEICFVELSDSLRELQQKAIECNESSIIHSDSNGAVSAVTTSGVKVKWFKFMQQVPMDQDIPCLFIGQEFLDAFPVHQFIQTNKGWREKLVDVDTSPDSPYHFRTVLAGSETPALKVLMQAIEV